MRTGTAVLAVWLAACGSTSTSTSTSPAPAPAPAPVTVIAPTPSPAPSPTSSGSGYELHEWGVVDVPSDGSAVELAAGAGRIERPMSVRKPVIYVRLVGGATEATFGLRVALGGGTIVEHYPAATFTGGGLEWPSVVARAAHASARWASDPSRGATGCGTPDGVCEVLELEHYDAPSAAGLDVGGVQTGLLFYRASMPSVTLPLTAGRGADMTVHVSATTSMAGAAGSIWRLSTSLSGPWPIGRVVVSRAAFPTPGASVDIGVGTTVITRAEGVQELGQALASLGMTEDETAAFMAGWADELFGADAAGARREVRDLAAQGPRLQDVLLFFLPEPAVDAISTLTATPPPRSIRRAFLIRIDLGPVATG